MKPEHEKSILTLSWQRIMYPAGSFVQVGMSIKTPNCFLNGIPICTDKLFRT